MGNGSGATPEFRYVHNPTCFFADLLDVTSGHLGNT